MTSALSTRISFICQDHSIPAGRFKSKFSELLYMVSSTPFSFGVISSESYSGLLACLKITPFLAYQQTWTNGSLRLYFPSYSLSDSWLIRLTRLKRSCNSKINLPTEASNNAAIALQVLPLLLYKHPRVTNRQLNIKRSVVSCNSWILFSWFNICGTKLTTDTFTLSTRSPFPFLSQSACLLNASHPFGLLCMENCRSFRNFHMITVSAEIMRLLNRYSKWVKLYTDFSYLVTS